MEAKDTILGKEEQECIINMGSRHFYSANERLCKAQAEATWKVAFEEGKIAGMKEVAEWVRNHFGIWNHGAEWLVFLDKLGLTLSRKESQLLEGYK